MISSKNACFFLMAAFYALVEKENSAINGEHFVGDRQH